MLVFNQKKNDIGLLGYLVCGSRSKYLGKTFLFLFDVVVVVVVHFTMQSTHALTTLLTQYHLLLMWRFQTVCFFHNY